MKLFSEREIEISLS